MSGARARDGKAGAIRPGLSLLVLLVVGAGLLALAPAAGATQYQRPFIGTFESAGNLKFEHAESLAIDQTNGDVLVGNGQTDAIEKFNSAGTPQDFAALGSSAIDGKPGPGGKPCAEEPASCDQTPQGEIEAGFTVGIAPQIAIDPVNGNIYITQYNQDLVDIFSSEGKYLGQLTQAGTKNFSNPCGVVVDAAGTVYVAQSSEIDKFVPSGDPPVNGDNTAKFPLEAEYGCRMALGTGPSAGYIFIPGGHYFTSFKILKVNVETGAYTTYLDGQSGSPAVDPTTGNPLIKGEANGPELVEFNGSLESTNTVLSRLFLEAENRPSINDFAFDAAGDVYVSHTQTSYLPGPISIYGPPAIVATAAINSASGVTASAATLSGTVNPEGTTVSECYFEWGESAHFEDQTFPQWEHTVPCVGSVPADSVAHEVQASLSGLKPNGVTYNFRVAARNENGTERSAAEFFATAKTVTTEPATVTGTAAATLNGSLRPEDSQYTECVFEWGLVTAVGFEDTAPCQPEAGEIPADSGRYPVSLPLTGLQEGARYRFRLKATNGEGTVAGSSLTFETFGPPQISELRARDANKDSATMEAHLNPGGFATSYWFEWGLTTGYGQVVPADPGSVGSGQAPVVVSADLGGLEVGAIYHYRVVAESRGEKFESKDQTLETLDSCGLPEGRCYELVSRRDAGPVAIPGEPGPPIDQYYQASTEPGGLSYVVESGYPDATKGYGVIYRALRGAEGWTSTQVSTPIVTTDLSNGVGSVSGETQWLSNNLLCGFGESNQPLTNDPGPRFLYENGRASLYRLNSGGSYTAVPAFAPESIEGGNILTIDASQNCGKVLFSSQFTYPRIPGAGVTRLYEWEAGKLRNVGLVPAPGGGEEVVEAGVKIGGNAVSEDGSRVFFGATRQTSPNAQEVGKHGVFVREDGTTRDISLSETSTADSGAGFIYATADGSKAFFTANAGLTAESSAAGTDLYEYDLEKKPSEHPLSDLSVDHGAGGSGVAGFVGVSADGTHVYFISQDQFFPGLGDTREENVTKNTYSLYASTGGQVSFVATVGGSHQELGYLTEPGQRDWTSQVSPDGRYLLFETGTNVTGYDSGGALEAYLYDSQDGSIVCVTCRQDGQPSVAPAGTRVLAGGELINNPHHPVQSLTEGKSGPQVFFASLDALAPGAVVGQNNVYEWSHGQVFRLASARENQTATPIVGAYATFLGADTEGSDAYLVTPETLNWEDGDERLSVYDARVGGGFPEPAAPQEPCNAEAEGSCHSPSQQAGGTPAAGSSTFSGAGNVKQKPQKKKPHKKKKHKKAQQKKKKAKHKHKSKSKKKKQGAKGDRGAGK